ncbi:MAG: hypothetical protein ACRC0G_08340 [Fusobacteriaceae bacterium]
MKRENKDEIVKRIKYYLKDRYTPKIVKRVEITQEHGGRDDLDNLMLLDFSFKTLLKSENREQYYKDNENYARILKTLSKYK